MNNLIKWGLPGLMTFSFANVMSQQINPMTEAVLRNYSEILAENPKDYLTLYDRAYQYFTMGEYVRALSDIDMALEYTPEKDTDYRMSELSLKSDILSAQRNYTDAIQALNSALAINPTSQPELYKLGNLYLVNNNPSEALKAFQMLQRQNARSQEAFYGMAKANAMMGKTDEANSLLEEVKNLGSNSITTYCRIGDLYADMGNIKEATTNYIIAYTMDGANNRPLDSLRALFRQNPKEVLATLNEIIGSSQQNSSLNYIKAILTYDAGLYAETEQACNQLLDTTEEKTPALYRMKALSQLAQNKVQEAQETIREAEALAPGNPAVLADKAEILMSTDSRGAYEAISTALASSPDEESFMLLAAQCAILAEKYPEAISLLNNLVLTNPSNGMALLLRGLANAANKDEKAATNDYTRAGNMHQGGDIKDIVIAAIGKSKAGKKLDAEGMINDAAAKVGTDKDGLYYIAVYYAQTGNLDKAKEYSDKALLNGYNNLYNLSANNNEPLFNLSPLYKK